MVIMEIFGIGPLEFLLIIVLMLLVLGPEQMLATARKIGVFIRQLVRSPIWGDVMDTSREIRNLPSKIIQEAGLEDDIAQIKEAAKAPTQMLNDAAKQLTVEIEPIKIPKIDLKSATNKPASPTSQQPPVTNKVVDVAPLAVVATETEIKPDVNLSLNSGTGAEMGTPLQVEFATAPQPDPLPSSATGPAEPLQVEFGEMFPGSVTSEPSSQTIPDAKTDPAPSDEPANQITAPKRHYRRAKKLLVDDQSSMMEPKSVEITDQAAGDITSVPAEPETSSTTEPKKRRPKRNTDGGKTELMAEALTTHEIGRSNGNGT